MDKSVKSSNLGEKLRSTDANIGREMATSAGFNLEKEQIDYRSEKESRCENNEENKSEQSSEIVKETTSNDIPRNYADKQLEIINKVLARESEEKTKLIDSLTEYILMNCSDNFDSLAKISNQCKSFTSIQNSSQVKSLIQLSQGFMLCSLCTQYYRISDIKLIWCKRETCRICIYCRIKSNPNSCSGCKRCYSDNEKLKIRLKSE